MSALWKSAYILMKSTALSGLPGIRKIRNTVYTRYLGAGRGFNVSDMVVIRAAHRNKDSFFKAGDGLRIGSHTEIDFSGGISFGTNVTVSEGVRIFTHDHAVDGAADWRKNPISFSQLTVGDFAWIGANSMVLNSVKSIGEGAIIAAGAVVRSNVDPYTIVAGVPAKVIRKRNIVPDAE